MFNVRRFAPIFILLLAQILWADPGRIVSLAPSATKCIDLLGCGNKLVGITVYCPDPSNSIEKIGTVLEPNIEKIVSLKPDLIIASKEANQIQSVEKLRQMGFQVYVMDSSNNFDDICRVFIGLGRFLKLEQKAEDIVNQSKLRVEQVKKRVEKLSKPSVFWEVGAQPMFTVSKKSFVNDFIVFAGGQNIFSELPSRYPQISREEVVLRDPDYIIMVTMGDLGSHELASWAKFKTLKAVKYSRVMCLQESIFTIPTPDAIAAGIEKISGILHPK